MKRLGVIALAGAALVAGSAALAQAPDQGAGGTVTLQQALKDAELARAIAEAKAATAKANAAKAQADADAAKAQAEARSAAAQADAIVNRMGDGQTVQQGLKDAELEKARAEARTAKAAARFNERLFNEAADPNAPGEQMFRRLEGRQ
jgi:hypothetical protein